MLEPYSRENELAERFCRHYISTLMQSLPKKHRTYGFEYEFLPGAKLDIMDMGRIDRFLEAMGGEKVAGERLFDNGMRVTFEPGGQIEYCSPPLLADDYDRFNALLRFVDAMNDRIRDDLGINYQAVGYLPGRANFPLCLRSTRYLQLHKRLSQSGSRGHEMMKGTASIHLHVSISNLDELLPLFYFLCRLGNTREFGMSEDRRDIWNHTDASRSGQPRCCTEELDSPEALIDRLVRYALKVVVLGEQVPFESSSDRSFSAFLYHMTTIFTDVRFNLKGPTLELRTLDSIPTGEFTHKWFEFIRLAKTIT
jgi:gamma-glutamylcysteine synthetase